MSSDKGSEEYEVERILDKKKMGGVWKYQIKWLGYSLDECTWEPKENLINVEDLLDEFENDWLTKNKPTKEKSSGVKKTKSELSESPIFLENESEKNAEENLLKKKRKQVEGIPGKKLVDEYENIPMFVSQVLEAEDSTKDDEENKTKSKMKSPKKLIKEKKNKSPKKIKNSDLISSNSNAHILISDEEPIPTDANLEKVDKIKRIITAKQGANKEVLCLVEWMPRSNGAKPPDSFLSHLIVRKDAPQLLLDFYESRLKFPSNQTNN